MPLSALIDDARSFLAPRVRRTPVERSEALSRVLGVPVWLKLESTQLTGSFKIRGAWFALHRLGSEARRGVVTCSAGNHGLGLAHACREEGIPLVVFVPSSVDASKLDGLVRLDADVRTTPHPGFDESERWALEQAADLHLPYVSAYDDEAVLAGNGGTVGREILEQVPGVRTIVLPVGGGGMAAGLSVPFTQSVPDGRLVAAQLEASPALAESLKAGHAITRMPPVRTLAGGLEGGLGRVPFGYLQNRIHDVVLVDEPAIWSAVRWMRSEHDMVIEPSAAVAVAACLSGDVRANGDTVVIITGRNVSTESLERILTSDPDSDATD